MDSSNDFKILSSLFIKFYGVSPEKMVSLSGSGSNRRYYRLSSAGAGVSCIGVAGTDCRENSSFIGLSHVFRRYGINVPEVYEVDCSGLYYIQRDLGNESLFSLLGNEDSDVLVKKCLEQLVEIQTVPFNEWETKVFNAPFSSRQVMWDLNYFKYEFLKICSVTFDEDTLEDDFENLARSLATVDNSTWGFMYRDCQSRNVMVKDNDVWWIDFQGGRFGPSLYDAVSFLWQAKAGFSDGFRNEMLEFYSEVYSGKQGTDKDSLLKRAKEFAFFRTLQVLGAYGLRGLVEKKAHFLESIPYALDNLRKLIEDGVAAVYPELERVLKNICALERFKGESHDGLKVKVFSFSYKKGYPEDFSGNGGGFMFDCRAMHNPGRYEEYKHLTGLDKPVIDFLEEKKEVQGFVKKALELVRPSVERYLKRGFTNLQVGFGCTGGRHRSVYCAESLAKQLWEIFPEVEIEIIHREHGIHKVYGKK